MPNSLHRRAGDHQPSLEGSVAFAGFEMDADLAELRHHGSPVVVGATALRLLGSLVAHAGEYVSTEALMRDVWRGTAVSEASVYTTLRELRRALGDDGRQQRIVETKRGRGYRLTVPVCVLEQQRLGSAEIGERWNALQGEPASLAMNARILRRTGGDAALADALLEQLRSEGLSGLEAAFRAEFAPLPFDLLEQAVGPLTPLKPEWSWVLQRCAIFGTEFDPGRVVALGAASRDQVAAALDGAVALGWLAEIPAKSRRMRFSEAAASEYLTGTLALSERESLHASAARLLEAESDEPERAREVAWHWLRAGALAPHAIPWSRRAADAFGGGPGREEAVILRFAALSVAADTTWQERFDLSSELGDALFAVGEREAARRAHGRAIALAREHGDFVRMAEAVLRHAGSAINLETTIFSARRVALLEEALTHEPVLGYGQVALLQARLAQELGWGGRSEEARQRIDDALSRVREAGADPRHAVAVLHDAYWVTWSPDNTEERIALGAEMRAAADAADEPVLGALAGALHGAALLESGDRTAAEVAYSVGADLDDEEHGVTLLRSGRLVSVALLEGRFGEAEELAERARENGQRRGSLNVDGIYVAQLAWIRFDQGRLHELEPFADPILGSPGALQRAGRALILACSGRETEARGELSDLVSQLSEIPRDLFWTATHATLVEVASSLAVPEVASALYAALLPYADRSVLLGVRTVCRGSVELYLGLAARTLGRLEDAADHFERATLANARLRAVPLLARSQLALADALQAVGAAGSAERARAARAEGLRIRVQLGLARASEPA